MWEFNTDMHLSKQKPAELPKVVMGRDIILDKEEKHRCCPMFELHPISIWRSFSTKPASIEKLKDIILQPSNSPIA